MSHKLLLLLMWVWLLLLPLLLHQMRGLRELRSRLAAMTHYDAVRM